VKVRDSQVQQRVVSAVGAASDAGLAISPLRSAATGAAYIMAQGSSYKVEYPAAYQSYLYTS
jgi:hypothetical protein